MTATASANATCVEVRWHAASASDLNNCVEVHHADGWVEVRDSKAYRNPWRRLLALLRLRDATVLRFTPAQWELLLDDVAAGHFHYSRFAPLQFARTERVAFEAGVLAGEFDLPQEEVRS